MRPMTCVVAALLMWSQGSPCVAGGFKGGHLGGGGMGGARPNMGNISRPNVQMNRPSMPMQRPNVSVPNMQRPNVSRPSMTRPNVPSNFPGSSGGRPPMNINRPNVPNVSGGLKPSTWPTTLPSTRPAPGTSTLPGNIGSNGNRPNLERPSINRPNVTRPNIQTPDLTRPNITRPGNERPGIERPSTGRPSTERPSIDVSQITRPSQRPAFPDLSGGGQTRPTRPSVRPERPTTRPSPGDVGDFLGIPGGIRPENRPAERPGIAERPGTANRPNNQLPEIIRPGENRPGTNRPGMERPNIERPTTLPGTQLPNIVRPSERPSLDDLRPGVTGRPGWNDRPIDIGNIQIGNNVINNRPSWVNIDRDTVGVINNRWQNQINGLHGWATTRPARLDYWRGWGDGVRFRWHGHHHHYQWFTGNWWYNHPGGLCRWHYYHRFNHYPWYYWWQTPTWNTFSTWFTWTAPQTVWAQPIYYDYGNGGNVTYQADSVYINQERVATADEFAESAAALATVQPPGSDEEAEEAEWLPLGTFAMSTDNSDVEPARVLQLAVDKSGIVSGTLYNRDTDESQAVQGRVDRETQRVALRFGEGDRVVAETGLYNLTQDDVPLLVHFGPDRVENFILVRLPAPEET